MLFLVAFDLLSILAMSSHCLGVFVTGMDPPFVDALLSFVIYIQLLLCSDVYILLEEHRNVQFSLRYRLAYSS